MFGLLGRGRGKGGRCELWVGTKEMVVDSGY